MNALEMIFRGSMFLLSAGLVTLGYSMFAHQDYHWQRHAARVRAQGKRPRRTDAWAQRKMLMGICFVIVGLCCIPLWFYTPFS